MKIEDTLKSVEQLITNYINTNKTSPQRIFESIDRNKTGMISFEEFLMWMTKISPKITMEMANSYYSEFKRPVNKINFEAKLNHGLQSSKNEIIKQFSEINKII